MTDDELPFDPSRLPDPDFKAPLVDFSAKVPDYIGYMEGWRSWEVSGEKPLFGNPIKLYSVRTDYYWAPRRVSIAECDRCPVDERPGASCGCGFYSAKTLDHLLSMRYHTYNGARNGKYCCIGQVANWGNLEEGNLGWRAQKSYPIHVYVPYEVWHLAPLIKEAYGCKVSLLNFLKEQVSVA